MASERKMKIKDKRKDRIIVRESSMPWNQAGYKAQLQKDLKDIRQKLSRLLGQDLAKSDNSFVEATSPVKCIEGGVWSTSACRGLVRGGVVVTPQKPADRFPNSSDGCSKSSEGCPTPETSPLRPPKPPRTEVRQYSWRNFTRKEVCMYIRKLKPLKARKNKREVKSRHRESMNYDVMINDDALNSGVIVASPDSDVTIRDLEVNKTIARKRYAPRKQSLRHSKGILKSSLRGCSRTFTKITLLLAIVISVFGGLFNIRLAERKSTIGTSSILFPSEPLATICFRESLFLSILRESSATIIGINGRLCSCINKGTFLNNNNQLIGRMDRAGFTCLLALGPTSSVGPPSPNFYISPNFVSGPPLRQFLYLIFSHNVIYRLRPVGPLLPVGPRPMAYVAYWEIRPCVWKYYIIR